MGDEKKNPANSSPITDHASQSLNPSLITLHSSLSVIDTHCHLDMKEFDSDREEVIERAKASGIEAMITVGSDLEGTARAMKLAGEYDVIFASIGVHPHDAKDFSDDIYLKLREWSGNSKVLLSAKQVLTIITTTLRARCKEQFSKNTSGLREKQACLSSYTAGRPKEIPSRYCKDQE
jgi:hypothetical protein